MFLSRPCPYCGKKMRLSMNTCPHCKGAVPSGERSTGAGRVSRFLLIAGAFFGTIALTLIALPDRPEASSGPSRTRQTGVPASTERKKPPQQPDDTAEERKQKAKERQGRLQRLIEEQKEKAARQLAEKEERLVYARRVDNIRGGPSTNHSIVKHTEALEKLPYLSKEGKWYKLIVPEGETEQWVHESVVMTSAEKDAWQAEVAAGHATTFIRVAKNDSAPLLKEARGTRETEVLAKIPGPTELDVIESKDTSSGRAIIRFFKVNYKGKQGWVNQYYTTGEAFTRTPQGETAAPIPGADGGRMAEFSQYLKRQWMENAVKDSAITYVEFGNDTTMWVRLTRDKYTTKDQGVLLAENIARQYRMQTGYESLVAVHILHPDSNKEWAVGRVP